MKILVVCQYYYPEPVRISDICEELVRQGHTVDVLTGVPNYPMGQIYDEYRKGNKRRETINGVNVYRTFTIARRSGILYRFLNYFSYAISSGNYVSKLDSDYDVVFVNQLSPVMMAEAGVKYKKKNGAKLVLYCLDLWPESLVVGGIKRGSLIYKIFDKVSKKIYHFADRILVSSKEFVTYFDEHFDISKDKLRYLPQYAEELFVPQERCNNDKVELTFAGNIGSAQSVETIIRAAAELKDFDNLKFNVIGDGSDLDNCKKLAKELNADNVEFYGRRPLEEMPEFYKEADAMLVSLSDDPVISMTLPGKVQSYMAAGKPVIGAINGEAAKIIKEAECGFCGPSGDFKKLAENVRLFMKSDKQKLGNNSRAYYLKYFEKKVFIDTLTTELSNR